MRRPHYAWTICLGGALSLLVVIGLGVNVFTVYQPYIIDLNGFTNAQGSMITTVRSLFVLFAMLSVNRVCARLGICRVMTLGVLLVAASCMVYAVGGPFQMYCVGAALGGIGYGYGGMVPLSLVIGHWFRDRRSFALGLASAGSGVSTIIAPSILTWIIENYSMRMAFLVEAACILVIGALVWRLIRGGPEEMGLEAYHLGGQTDQKNGPEGNSSDIGRGLWWALLFASFLSGAPGGPGFSHLTVLFSSCGYDSMLVAGLMSFMGFMLIVGKLLGGQVYDMVGGWWGNIYMFGVFLAGLALCWLAPAGGVVLPVLTIFLLGLGFPLSAIPFPVWARDLVGSGGYEHAVQSLNVAYAWGSLLFGAVPGMLADRFGSYVPAYIMFFALLVVSMTIVQYAYIRRGAARHSVGTTC